MKLFLTEAYDIRVLEFFARKLLSRSCTYELAYKKLAHRKKFVLVPHRSSVCTSALNTNSSERDQSYVDQSQC